MYTYVYRFGTVIVNLLILLRQFCQEKKSKGLPICKYSTPRDKKDHLFIKEPKIYDPQKRASEP
jgi:hypothetical protein